MTHEEAKAYTTEWLPEADRIGLCGWIESELQAERFWPCPHCHFLNRTGDPCAVCAQRRDALEDAFASVIGQADFSKASRRLLEGREKRAQAFHDLNMNAYNAAIDLLFAAMNEPLKAMEKSLP